MLVPKGSFRLYLDCVDFGLCFDCFLDFEDLHNFDSTIYTTKVTNDIDVPILSKLNQII